MSDRALNMRQPDEPHREKPMVALQAELERTVGMLLSTQQMLIDIRHKSDAEQRVLEGIVRFSQRQQLDHSGTSFWECVADAGAETFDCEYCLVVEQEASIMRILAARGPEITGPQESDQIAHIIDQCLRDETHILNGEALAKVCIGGQQLATLMLTIVQQPENLPWRLLVTAVSVKKQGFFPKMEKKSLPGLRMLASHVNVLHMMLQSQQQVTAQLKDLDRAHNALTRANDDLENQVAKQHIAAILLGENEQKYRAIFDGSADGMALVEIETQNLVECNQALTQMTASGRAKLIGKQISAFASFSLDAILDDSKKRSGSHLDQRVDRGHLVTSENNLIPVEFKSSELHLSGRKYQLFVFHDISNRTRAEEEKEKLLSQLAQSHKMEAIGRLAGGVAHDFNNLLTVICGYTELLSGETNLQRHQTDQLHEILAASQRARALTQQLLMFSRKQVIRPILADMNQQIESSLRIYRRLIGEDINLNFQPCEEPTPILADPQQLDQIIGNLLINARDAINACTTGTHNREISIVTGIVDKVSKSRVLGRHVRVTLTDTGFGMDSDTLNNIFEPFFTTKDIGKGTGLGLATVFGVIQQNNGSIEVQSKLGSGTQFTIYWPQNLSDIMLTQIAKETSSVLTGTEYVILVEDDQRVRDFVTHGLTKFGYRVAVFQNAADALEMLGNCTPEPDIIVTDVVMPGMDGREFANAALRQRPDLPVIFISGYTDDIIARHGVVQSGETLLEKPFSINALAKKIRELLDARQQRSSN